MNETKQWKEVAVLVFERKTERAESDACTTATGWSALVPCCPFVECSAAQKKRISQPVGGAAAPG
jgi:hypothetical protein